MMIVQAVILVGGFGTRLGNLTKEIPKPMVNINGKPFLYYIIKKLAGHVDEIILCVGYKKEKIMEYFKDGKDMGVKIKYSIEEKPLGTGGAIKNAEGLIRGDFILMNGDTFHNIDLNDLKNYFEKNNMNVMVVTKTINPTQVTIVKIDDDNNIISFKERPKNPAPEDKYMNAGIYVFKKEVLSLIKKGKVSLEKEIFPILLKKGLKAYFYDGFYIDIGTPNNLNKFKKFFEEKNQDNDAL